MELRVLGYFLAIAREQSIIRAAASLHLSQPTLSTQIRKLEEELGKQLLVRGSKGSRKVTLTEEGMILKKRAEEILHLVEKTEKEITFSDHGVVGDVYIGAGETDALRLLAQAAKALHQSHPGIFKALYFVKSTLPNTIPKSISPFSNCSSTNSALPLER